MQQKKNIWDAVIVGGGPAGLSAGIYLSRLGFETLLLEKAHLGGTARRLEVVENYPGFPEGISGAELMGRFVSQTLRFGLKLKMAEVRRVSKKAGLFHLNLKDGAENPKARAVILCAGSEFKRLGLPEEKRLLGKGIFHGAFERASQFLNKKTAVVGGGDAALHQALLLSRYAQKVTLIHRRKSFKANPLLRRRLQADSCIRPLFRHMVAGAEGKRRLRGIWVSGLDGKKKRFLRVSGLFVLIGKRPATALKNGLKPSQGCFTAGDLKMGSCRQVAIAAGDGVRAAMECEKFLLKCGS